MSGDDQRLLSELALTAFKLNGRFLDLAEELARPAGLTAAWWQVLGAVLPGPLPVAGIAREMGMSRQGVQRVADLLVEKGMCEYDDNPAHRRAKLVRATEVGRAAIRQIAPQHKRAARRLAAAVGHDELSATLDAMQRLSAALAEVRAR